MPGQTLYVATFHDVLLATEHSGSLDQKSEAFTHDIWAYSDEDALEQAQSILADIIIPSRELMSVGKKEKFGVIVEE